MFNNMGNKGTEKGMDKEDNMADNSKDLAQVQRQLKERFPLINQPLPSQDKSQNHPLIFRSLPYTDILPYIHHLDTLIQYLVLLLLDFHKVKESYYGILLKHHDHYQY